MGLDSGMLKLKFLFQDLSQHLPEGTTSPPAPKRFLVYSVFTAHASKKHNETRLP